jgi:UDP-2-acetamido-2,6-beta-L-arabino-hexul-4-ose reductase
MVIGSGLIAKSFSKNKLFDNYLIFASGVSNSNTTDENEFKREENLLMKSLSTDKPLIYFSSIFSSSIDNPYFNHKRDMENLIKNNNSNFYIFRMPQIIGNGGNVNNIINLFVSNILNDKKIEIWKDSERSIVDIDDVVSIISYIIKNKPNNKIYNVSGIESTPVIEIVKILEDILSKKSIISFIDKKSILPSFNCVEIEDSINSLLIDKEDYTKKILKKYVKY